MRVCFISFLFHFITWDFILLVEFKKVFSFSLIQIILCIFDLSDWNGCKTDVIDKFCTIANGMHCAANDASSSTGTQKHKFSVHKTTQKWILCITKSQIFDRFGAKDLFTLSTKYTQTPHQLEISYCYSQFEVSRNKITSMWFKTRFKFINQFRDGTVECSKWT